MQFTDAHLQGFLAIIERRDASGAHVWGDDVLKAFVPILFLASGGTADAPKGSALDVALRAFTVEAGLTATTSPAEASASIEKWLVAHEPPQALVEELRAFLIEVRTPDAANAAALLGAASSKIPVGARPAPAGATKASPTARFTMDAPKPKKPNDEA